MKQLPVSYGFDSVAIVQKFNICKSRLDTDIRSEVIKGVILDVPMISANMSTVTNADFAIEMAQVGGLGVLHRAQNIDTYLSEVKKVAKKCTWVAASIGTSVSDKELATNLIQAGANIIVIDIAHGYCEIMLDMLNFVKSYFPDIKVVVGNTVNPNAIKYFEKADAIKIGIGSGCFAAGTRILMANGTYKNIEQIVIGDIVINGEGNPSLVKRSFCTGIKKVNKLRNSIWYEDTYVTPDHKYFIGDLNNVSKTTLSSAGYAKLLDKLDKTTPKISKFKWKTIKELSQDVLLMPKYINFDLKDNFEIPILKRCSGNRITGETYSVDNIMTPSNELGYIFGTFLGDGNARVGFDKKKKSNKGSLNWTFGIDEDLIADKLVSCIKKIFNKDSKIVKNTNTIKVNLYYKPLADILNTWGKKSSKNIPSELIVNNNDYLNGLLEGLIDSDGTWNNSSKYGKTSFNNTSTQLIELFNVIYYLLNKSWPNNSKRQKSIGKLKNIDIKNCNTPYIAEVLRGHDKRNTKQYQACKILENNITNINALVYDIEIDDDTHSFIANNAIVHNSACETASTAGCTAGQFSAVYECAREAMQIGMPLISDGGVKNGSHFSKAIGAGANSIMGGYIFARCPESAAEVIITDKGPMKVYSGMASRAVQTEWRAGLKPGTCSEGKTVLLELGQPLVDLVERYTGALRSGITYSAANTIDSFHKNVEFIELR